jgi:hypothetical protein
MPRADRGSCSSAAGSLTGGVFSASTSANRDDVDDDVNALLQDPELIQEAVPIIMDIVIRFGGVLRVRPSLARRRGSTS